MIQREVMGKSRNIRSCKSVRKQHKELRDSIPSYMTECTNYVLKILPEKGELKITCSVSEKKQQQKQENTFLKLCEKV